MNLSTAVFAGLMLATLTAEAQQLATMPLTISNNTITAEVAATQPERETGLMNRFSLRSDQGMLFVFDGPQQIVMWMKNTYIPLSVAFMDREGKILNIEDMQPQTLDPHPSTGMALYALEMRKGWFKERNIKAGIKVEGLEKAPKGKS
jgi:hypothetical protein